MENNYKETQNNQEQKNYLNKSENNQQETTNNHSDTL